MLPGLIVLAPSASFSFNRDHYPPGEDPPTCRFGRKCIERGCTHATTFSSALDEALTYTNCLTYLGHACLRPWVWHLCVEKGIDAIPQLIRLPWRLTNERTSVQEHFSLFSLSIQINSLIKELDVASWKRQLRRARLITYRLEVHHDAVERMNNK